MKERPILFSAPMVRAILDGRKTQTRRVAPIADLAIRQNDGNIVTWSVDFSKPVRGIMRSHSGGKLSVEQARAVIASMFCSYGKPGDCLWVRETWAPADGRYEHFQPIVYRADGCNTARLDDRWRSSIHMPRWASRITLEITGVRVERLQEISEEDAKAEGAKLVDEATGRQVLFGESSRCGSYRYGFRAVWESINGPGSWDANPWVWAIEFRRAEQAVGVA